MLFFFFFTTFLTTSLCFVGAKDMLRAYRDMREANWKNSDKYFHARGNYDAASRGPGGRWAAEVIRYIRFDMILFIIYTEQERLFPCSVMQQQLSVLLWMFKLFLRILNCNVIKSLFWYVQQCKRGSAGGW